MQQHTDISLSISNPAPSLNTIQKIALLLLSLGLLIGFVALLNTSFAENPFMLIGAISLSTLGSAIFIHQTYKGTVPGIKNNHIWFKSFTSRGALGWMAGIVITGFYVLLYWYPQYLEGLIRLFDPLSIALKAKPASQWFVYGSIYTLAILIMGVKFIIKYRHNQYQVIRTISVMFFQTAFAFLIPEILERLNKPLSTNWFGTDIKNMWPLDYDFFFDWHLNNLTNGGKLGLFMLILGIAMIFIISPLLTYFFGKRWYCSWVCGCGGLAETAGDPFRQLSDKSLKAWKVERWMIHSILVFVFIMTALVLYTRFTGHSKFLFLDSYKVSKHYGFFIGAAFSGVIGVGFYPILGSRVWCRFGCPMAAVLGIQQKFLSRFRITTNGGQCISCGNCSTYCEMGIDVRSYAQKGQNIVRASCVGCGICAAVCPRGVLRLENGPDTGTEKTEIKPVIITEDQINILS